MNYKYYISQSGLAVELSNNNYIDISQPPIRLGNKTHISYDNSHYFVSVTKANSNLDGEVFVYNFDTINKNWSYSTGLYNTAYVDISNHEGANGVYSGYFGSSITSSHDNTYLFIGMKGYRQGAISRGCVVVFKKINNSWTLFQTIKGPNANYGIGASIACSSDGSRLFIGTNNNNYGNSNLLVYNYDSNSSSFVEYTGFTFKQTLTNGGGSSNFASSLSCSNDGNTLVVGSSNYLQLRPSDNQIVYNGGVLIFKYSNNSWSLLQDLITDISNNTSALVYASGLEVGKDVSISGNGNKLIVSTNLNISNKNGALFYFEYNSNTNSYDYKQTLSNNNILLNAASGDSYGQEAKISNDGNYMITCIYNKKILNYHYDNSSYWSLDTNYQNIENDISNSYFDPTVYLTNLGEGLSLSGSGKYISFGSPGYKYNSKIVGESFIMHRKNKQVISNFSNISYQYGTTNTLSAVSNSGLSPSYSGTSTLYSLSGSSLTINNVGSDSLDVTYSENYDYLETSESITVTGIKANQTINYNAAIDVQGSLNLGQTSGLTYSSIHSLTNSNTNLSVVISISGNSIQFDPINNEFEAIANGNSIVSLTQSGNTYYNAATTINITYNVTTTPSVAYPPGYSASETGIPINDLYQTSEGQNTLINLPLAPEIINLIPQGFIENTVANKKLYSIPVNDISLFDNLKRTTFKRIDSEFNFNIKSMPTNINYFNIEIKPKEEINNFTVMTQENKNLLNSLNNSTEIITLDKYVDVGGNYNKESGYATLRIYHPYDTLVMYRIDDNEEVTEVNETNYPESSILRESSESNYWYVKMPFSSAFGGTSSSTSSSGDPYINSILGSLYKLDDIPGSYRLLQGNNIIINGSTDYPTKSHKNRILRHSNKLIQTNKKLRKQLIDGTYYKEFFIKNENEELYINLQNEKIYTNNQNLKIQKKYRSLGSYGLYCNKLVFSFENKNNGLIEVEIEFYKQPQIENGINIKIEKNIKSLSGLLINNYNQQSLKLNNIKCIETKKGILETKKKIYNQNEKWIYLTNKGKLLIKNNKEIVKTIKQ